MSHTVTLTLCSSLAQQANLEHRTSTCTWQHSSTETHAPGFLIHRFNWFLEVSPSLDSKEKIYLFQKKTPSFVSMTTAKFNDHLLSQVNGSQQISRALWVFCPL